jgi:hypothetical protein
VSDLRVLPLPYYDMIIGMDWLEVHIPMRIDWKNKWISITQNASTVLLHGLQPAIPELSVIEVMFVSEQLENGDSLCFSQCDLPVPFQQLLDSYEHLFAEPSTLPPSRSCDHIIPLIEGAQLVNVRPYRFSPAMKDEIEQQVQEMSDKGFIQPRKSSFCSPVLLVKKKDKT